MPHDMIDEIQSRKGEKVALFLTFENAAGLILTVLPAFLLSAALTWWLRILLVLTAGAIGVLATLEVGGLAFYERMVWAVRGAIASRMAGNRITPEQLIGARVIARRDRALPVDGPIRAVSRRARAPVPPARAPQRRQPLDAPAEPASTPIEHRQNGEI